MQNSEAFLLVQRHVDHLRSISAVILLLHRRDPQCWAVLRYLRAAADTMQIDTQLAELLKDIATTYRQKV